MTIGELLQLTKENCAAILSAAMKYEAENGINGYNAVNSILPPFKTEFGFPLSIYPQTTEKPLEVPLNQFKGIETRGSYIVPEKQSKQGILYLTEKELMKMPKEFRKTFRVGRVKAHVRKKTNGVYEIRCTIEKTRISASSKRLEMAKEKFIDKLTELAKSIAEENKRKREKVYFAPKEEIKETTPVIAPVVPVVAPPVAPPSVTLGEYMKKWLETVKKPNVKANTYKLYFECYYKVNIVPVFGNRPMAEIKPFELQEFVNGLVNEGKAATAKCCTTILKAVFDYAVIDDIITKSPMIKVTYPHVEPKEGVPLSREEEKALVERMKETGNMFTQACVFILYTGLRRSELASVEIVDGWVNVVSAKGRKGYKEKRRSIPISPMLERLLPLLDIDGIKAINIDSLSYIARKIIKNHHIHELRHTFITRCQECGIRREIVSLWAGHAADSSITTQIYTHLQTNKQLQLDEIKKFDYEL